MDEHTAMTSPGNRMRRLRPLSRSTVVALSAVGVLAVGGGVFAATQLTSGSTGSDNAAATPASPAPPPVVTVQGLKRGKVPWNRRLTLEVTNGAFVSVEVTRPDGSGLIGSLTDHGTRWVSITSLVPLSHYVVQTVVRNDNGHDASATMKVVAADTKKHLQATLTPGDGNVVGVGSPVVVYFSRAVPESKRALVEDRLSVLTTPSVVGAWHWMNDQEVHWRPPTYWKPGTRVTVSADLDHLYLGGGVWGEGSHTASFRIGHSHISKVDGARHMMWVWDNGKLIRTIPVSVGRDKYPTKSGVHITFEKSYVVTMDSATVGIPRNSPDGYYEKVYWDVRISYGGAFVHAAPWSVADQGFVNVSHGCVNISTDNAIWFYNFSLRGDIVDIYNTGAAPDTSDPGMADWNMSWKQWVAGDAAPSPQALALHPPMPRSLEPAAPAVKTTSTSTSSSSPSPSASPSASPTRRHH